MFFWTLTSWMTHIRTPWPRKPRVQLSSNHHWSQLWVSKTNVFLTFEPDLYSNSDSPTPITQGPTKSQPSLVTISEFLNRCSFDPDANRQTNKQTNEFFSYDPPYSRGNKNQYLESTCILNLLIFIWIIQTTKTKLLNHLVGIRRCGIKDY